MVVRLGSAIFFWLEQPHFPTHPFNEGCVCGGGAGGGGGRGGGGCGGDGWDSDGYYKGGSY